MGGKRRATRARRLAAWWAGLATSCIVPFALAEPVPLEPGHWVVRAEEHAFETHLGRPSLLLRNGVAWVDGSRFKDGVIEFDVAFTGERGFSGVAWRMQDERNYEQFYLRPHQSGRPDACQYTPTYAGLTSWQLYHGPGYGAAVDYRTDGWNHVKLVVSGTQAEVYVNGGPTPALFVVRQKREVESGRVGLNSYSAPAHFSNFSYRQDAQPELAGEPPPAVGAPSGAILRWQVSDVFDGAVLGDATTLDPAIRAGRDWTSLDAEESGLANLGSVRALGPGQDTVFARASIDSEAARSTLLRFGYSDRARVYLNDALLYRGDNGYRSRDYRYLGTIGWFDEVVLPLRPGENELWIAVSESFGGWGVQAAIDDAAGLSPSGAAPELPSTDLFLVPIDGVVVGAPRRLTDRDGYDNQPAFLPDGERLVYSAADDGRTDVWQLDLVTGDRQRLRATAESEYSPTPIPGRPAVSVVRDYGESKQQLWAFPLDGGPPESLLPGVGPVGYHAWIDERSVLLFVLGDPLTLEIARVGAGASRVVGYSPGRALARIPSTGEMSYVDKRQATWWLVTLDPSTGESRRLMPTLPETEDYAWAPDGAVWAGRASGLFRRSLTDDEWRMIADFAADGIDGISRLVFSPDGRRLVLVARPVPRP
ncbi:MAG TPA: family 16 glycoside hydrolase [Candidatus Polarisedimenticolaceae bacterium]|nr:family 16 glycoside hydrolase [Candidatus Polarisedimenticolaceae bacterium]